MKGIVFTEFLEMVEAQFGPVACERVIAAARLPSGGAYTTVGTYDAGEMLALVRELAGDTNLAPGALVRAFGEHLFQRFVVLFPRFFVGISSAMQFLESVDGFIHEEVRKLYPDAELPRFDAVRPDPASLHLTYHSERPLADLAEGLIRACLQHFGEPLQLERCRLEGAEGTAVRFQLTCPKTTLQPTS